MADSKKGQKWPNCDSQIKAFVEKIIQALKDQAPQKLDTVILHGSLAMGSFYPPKSDIDLLVLIKEPLNIPEQKRIHKQLIETTNNRPIIGFLELSMILSRVARAPVHPIPFELHYGEGFPEKISSGLFDYNNAKGNDPDLAAHFMVARHRGISLYGSNPTSALGDIPWKNYYDSVLSDIEWILKDKNICETPFYGILNCCRFLEILEKGEGTVSSKEEGALWAISRLPNQHRPLIRFALDCYRSGASVTPSTRPKGGLNWDKKSLLSFRDFIKKKII